MTIKVRKRQVQGETEYQVVVGRRIYSRCETRSEAQDFADRLATEAQS